MLPWLRHQVQAAVQNRLQVASCSLHSLQGSATGNSLPEPTLPYPTLPNLTLPYPTPRKFCTTVTDTECRVTVKTGTKTVYEQQCSTVYQEKCSGSGYKKTCAPAPTQKCQQVQGRSRNRGRSRSISGG